MNDDGRCAMHHSGFSWLAGVSLLAWALQRRLYLLVALSVVIGVGLGLAAVSLQLSDAAQLALNAAVFVGNGALANPLHRVLLERSGWRVAAEESAPVGKAAG